MCWHHQNHIYFIKGPPVVFWESINVVKPCQKSYITTCLYVKLVQDFTDIKVNITVVLRLDVYI